MCTNVCVCVCVCVVCVFLCVCTHTYVCTHVFMFIHMPAFVYFCRPMNDLIIIFLCTYVHACTYMHVCTYIVVITIWLFYGAVLLQRSFGLINSLDSRTYISKLLTTSF